MARSLVESIIRVVSSMIMDAQQTADEIEMCSLNDPQIRILGNSPALEKVDRCLHHMVQERVMTAPSATAVQAWDGSLSYAELDDLSSALAARIASLGVEKGAYIPFCFEKSRWAVVSTLAILKSGAACVPLDRTHPDGRHRQIFDTIQPKVLLTSADAKRDSFFTHVTNVIVVPGDILSSADGDASASSWSDSSPSNPAFAIFTSGTWTKCFADVHQCRVQRISLLTDHAGSTGHPKAISLDHSALCTSIVHHASVFGMNHKSRVLQFAAFVFDPSISDIYATLILGGCLCIPNEMQRSNELAAFIRAAGINFAHLTPTVARLIQPQEVPELNTLVVGGEELGHDSIALWHPHVRLFNSYGPAECAIVASVHEVTGLAPESKTIGIGHGGARLWVTHPSNVQRLAPAGAIGEIVVEGPVVARGYIHHADSNASFIGPPTWAQPYPEHERHRFYRTGDLGRVNADGSVVYAGRRDRQLKIRGQRVDLSEVEHCLIKCKEIRHAAVVVPSAGSLQQKLVAVLTAPAGANSSTDIVRETLKLCAHTAFGPVATVRASIRDVAIETLPAYAVPEAFIFVEQMPQLSSGKLDRQRVARWVDTLTKEQVASALHRQQKDSLDAPRTNAEQILQRVWADVLNVDREILTRSSNWFQAGADSVTCMRMVPAARAAGLELFVADMFHHPMLRDMAAAARPLQDEKLGDVQRYTLLPGSADLPALRADVAARCNVNAELVEDVYPATSLQEGLMTLTSKQPGAYVSQTAYRLAPGMNGTRIRESWKQVTDSHAILRTRLVHTADCGTLQVVLKDDFHWTKFSDVGAYVEEDKAHGMGFGTPLCRFALSATHLVMTIHHGVYDGFALPMILGDFEKAYATGATTARRPYKHFISYIRDLDVPLCESFWTKQLQDAAVSPFPELPSPVYEPFADQACSRQMRLSRSANSGITTASLLRAAWALTISTYTGAVDVTFGAVVSGRDAPVVGLGEMAGSVQHVSSACFLRLTTLSQTYHCRGACS